MFYTKIDLFGFSLYEMCLLFVIWGFLGWGIECCFHALKMGEYSNRGFLSMPVCPIYGFGVLIITILLRPFVDSPLPMFFFSMIICTLFEFCVGVAMKKIFHNVWWDYTDEHFNFHGYICLKVSLEWGFGCLIVEGYVEPFIENILQYIPILFGTIFICIMAVLIIIDLINSVNAVTRLNLRLKEITEITDRMYDVSQKIGKSLADTALDAADAGMDAAVTVAASYYTGKEEIEGHVEEANRMFENFKRESLETLTARLDALIAFSDKGTSRLLRAYPRLKSIEYHDALMKIRTRR